MGELFNYIIISKIKKIKRECVTAFLFISSVCSSVKNRQKFYSAGQNLTANLEGSKRKRKNDQKKTRRKDFLYFTCWKQVLASVHRGLMLLRLLSYLCTGFIL